VPWRVRYYHGARLASWGRKRTVALTHSHARVTFGRYSYVGPGFSLTIPDGGTLEIGPGVQFRRGFVCEIAGNGRVVIGANTIFTAQALVQCSTSIVIDEGCIFGQAVLLADGQHRFEDLSVRFLDQGYDFRPLHIGREVVVHSKCTITADVGEHVILGAHSLVTRALPAYSVAFGSPARVTRDRRATSTGQIHADLPQTDRRAGKWER
jgi:acetyltransferase-like isoleucine patch superfamily enzyme